jgi:hypothetical protein
MKKESTCVVEFVCEAHPTDYERLDNESEGDRLTWDVEEHGRFASRFIST